MDPPPPPPLSFLWGTGLGSVGLVGGGSFAADHQNVQYVPVPAMEATEICYPGASPFRVKPADELRSRGSSSEGEGALIRVPD